MSTLDEYGGHVNPTETRLKRGDTRGQIDSVLQQFDVLPSSVDRFIFKYISLYLLGLFVPGELFLLLFFLNLSPQVQAHVGGVLLGGGLSALGVVVVLISLWLFHVWRARTPKTLRDLFEQMHIVMPDGDVTASYLSFLENYRNALASPKRHLLSGIPMICFSGYCLHYSQFQLRRIRKRFYHDSWCGRDSALRARYFRRIVRYRNNDVGNVHLGLVRQEACANIRVKHSAFPPGPMWWTQVAGQFLF